MKITFLGTGTSTGVPLIACTCPICTSVDPYNKRLRSSVLIEVSGQRILIDAAIDFRQQALRHHISDIDHILITHVHADHVFGLDEMRRFNLMYQKKIPIYLRDSDDQELRQVFRYMYEPVIQVGGGIADFNNHIIQHAQSFTIAGVTITPINVQHGLLTIFGYRINDFAYVTDCSAISAESMALLRGVKVLVLGALRDVPHPTHFSLDQAVAAAQEIKAAQTFFTHIGHSLDYQQTNNLLPNNMRLAYDGLELELL